MTTSFDDIVEQLLYDIALAGSKGIAAEDLEKAVKAIYDSRERNNLADSSTSGDELLFSNAPPTSPITVDDNLVNAVWKWLEKHPDIQVNMIEGVNAAQPLHPHSEAEQANRVPRTPSKHAGKRIFASSDRVWQAVAGHGVDPKRIPGMEFDLLCIVAAHGPAGILQPDLRKLSGQDKRSVPKRTDQLAAQGYISKEYVVANALQTSLLKHWKYASKPGDATSSLAGGLPENVRSYEMDVSRFDTWYRETIRMLKENDGIIALKDLRIGLGVYGNDKKPERKAYDKCIQRLVGAGNICKVKAKDEAAANTSIESWHKCLQLVHKPTENDRLIFSKMTTVHKGVKVRSTFAIPATNDQNDELDEDADLGRGEDAIDAGEPVDVDENLVPPQWTPDLPIQNSVQKPNPKLFTDKEGQASLLEYQAAALEDLRGKMQSDILFLQNNKENAPKGTPREKLRMSTNLASKPPKIRQTTKDDNDMYVKNARRIAESIARAEANRDAKRTADEAGMDDSPPKRKRGRPRKNDIVNAPVATTPEEFRINKIEKDIIEMEKPGVYINPPGSRDTKLDTRPKQGKPGKITVAVFKSERLRDLAWFKRDAIENSRKRPRTLSSSLVIDREEERFNDDEHLPKRKRLSGGPNSPTAVKTNREDLQGNRKTALVKLSLAREKLEKFTQPALQNIASPVTPVKKSLIAKLPLTSSSSESPRESLIVTLPISPNGMRQDIATNELQNELEAPSTDVSSAPMIDSSRGAKDAAVAPIPSLQQEETPLVEFPIIRGITVRRTAAGLAVTNGEAITARNRANAFSKWKREGGSPAVHHDLLMDPGQVFNEPSGTIGTEGTVGHVTHHSISVEAFWKRYHYIPRDLEDLLDRAMALGHTAVVTSADYNEQFFREIDQVAAWEKDMVRNGTVVDSGDWFVFINHKLGCEHVLTPLSAAVADDTFVEDPSLKDPSFLPLPIPTKIKQPSLKRRFSRKQPTPVARRNSIMNQHTSPNALHNLQGNVVANEFSATGLPTPSQSTSILQPVSYFNDNGFIRPLYPGPDISKFSMLSQLKYQDAEMTASMRPLPTPERPLAPDTQIPLQQMKMQDGLSHLESSVQLGTPAQLVGRIRNQHDYAVLAGQKRKKQFTYKSSKKLKTSIDDPEDITVDPAYADDSIKDPDYAPATKATPAKKTPTPSFQDSDRLVIAIALVSILSGNKQGDANFNWNIVDHALAFRYDASTLRKRWSYQKKNNESICQKLQSMLHEPFLEAYEKGEIPTIDFDSPGKTDWPALVRWAETEVWPACKTESNGEIADLPASRDDLERRFHIDGGSKPSDRFEKQSTTIAKKTSAIESGTEPAGQASNDDIVDRDMLVAMSWARAVAMTTDQDYQEAKAVAKLLRLNQDVLNKATAQLVEARTLVRKREGRRLEGRNLLIPKDMLLQFKRWPGGESEHLFLRNVAAARNKLIEHFQENEDMIVHPNVSEPEGFVLTHMLAQGHLKISVALPERIAELGSSIVVTDPSTFSFPVSYSKTTLFTANHGLNGDIAIPKIPPGSLQDALPIWIDINGKFLDSVWDMVLRSILHLVVFTPGSTGTTIAQAHAGHIQTWEIEMVLQWMEQVGLVQKLAVGSVVSDTKTVAYRPTQWWYCAFLPEIVTWRVAEGA